MAVTSGTSALCLPRVAGKAGTAGRRTKSVVSTACVARTWRSVFPLSAKWRRRKTRFEVFPDLLRLERSETSAQSRPHDHHISAAADPCSAHLCRRSDGESRSRVEPETPGAADASSLVCQATCSQPLKQATALPTPTRPCVGGTRPSTGGLWNALCQRKLQTRQERCRARRHGGSPGSSTEASVIQHRELGIFLPSHSGDVPAVPDVPYRTRRVLCGAVACPLDSIACL